MSKARQREIIEGLSEDFTRPATTVRREKLIKETFPIPPEKRKKIEEVDPWEKEKEKYKVNLSELLKVDVATLLKEESDKLDIATKYLLFDNYFEKVMVEGIKSLKEEGVELPVLTGEEQIIYFWFYRKSYGFGYRACPMSHIELVRKLGWSRNTVKKYLKSLEQKGIIKPILQPFKNKRPAVYEVIFPREFLERKLNSMREDRKDKAALRAMQEIKQMLSGIKI